MTCFDSYLEAVSMPAQHPQRSRTVNYRQGEGAAVVTVWISVQSSFVQQHQKAVVTSHRRASVKKSSILTKISAR